MSAASDVVHVDGQLRPLVPRFIENRRSEVPGLREAVARGDREELARVGHALKGTASSFGFDRLAGLGARLEASAKEGDFEEARAAVEEIAGHLDRVEVVYD